MLSPDEYFAWKLYDPAGSGPSVDEFGAAPLAMSAPPPEGVPVPVQPPLLKNVYATDPVGTNADDDGVTVDVSYADAPVFSFPDHPEFVAASNTIVAVELVPVFTVNGSQELVDPV